MRVARVNVTQSLVQHVVCQLVDRLLPGTNPTSFDVFVTQLLVRVRV